MFEPALQRFLDDLVVTVIFGFILKRALPCVTILELSERKHFRHAVWKVNRVVIVRHGERLEFRV
jgi:hypothetical protein